MQGPRIKTIQDITSIPPHIGHHACLHYGHNFLTAYTRINFNKHSIAVMKHRSRGALFSVSEHRNAPNRKLYVMLDVAFVPNISPALSRYTPIVDMAMASRFSPTVTLARANEAAWHATFTVLISSIDQCHCNPIAQQAASVAVANP